MFHIYIGILIILPIVDHKISQFELKNSGHLLKKHRNFVRGNRFYENSLNPSVDVNQFNQKCIDSIRIE